VQAARGVGSGSDATKQLQEAEDIQGRRVLTAYAHVAPLGWLVFVELPRAEAYATLYATMERSGIRLTNVCTAAMACSVTADKAAKIAKPIVETSIKVRQNLEKFVWSSREK
jgi:hypothetical protein